MHDDETNSFADQLLNAALAGYADEQARPGLEQRILAHLAEQPQPAAWWAWRWLPAGAMALVALLAGALLLFPGREATREAPPSSAPPSVASAPSPPAVSGPEALPTPLRARAPQAASASVRVAQFPTPSSLTEEERVLIRYLDSSPREVLVASVRTGGPLLDLQVQDVVVPRLELQPLPEPSGEATQN